MRTITGPRALAALLTLLPLGAGGQEGERLMTMNFREAPLQQVLLFYADITSQAVTVQEASYPVISLQSPGRINVAQALQLITSTLASNGIILTATGGVVHASPDPARMPAGVRQTLVLDSTTSPKPRPVMTGSPGSYAQRRAGRTAAATGDVLREHLLEYQREVIRQGLPPLPDARHVPSPEQPPGTP